MAKGAHPQGTTPSIWSRQLDQELILYGAHRSRFAQATPDGRRSSISSVRAVKVVGGTSAILADDY